MISFYDPALGVVAINGILMPGRCRIQGAGSTYVWEVRPGYGKSGAVVVGMGPGISKFTIFVDMWKREHLITWEAAKKVLAFPKRFIPSMAYSVTNPILADLEISEIVIEERGQFETGGAIWTVPLKCMQYRKPEEAKVRPRGAIPSAGGAGLAAQTEADKALVAEQAAFAQAKAGG